MQVVLGLTEMAQEAAVALLVRTELQDNLVTVVYMVAAQAANTLLLT